MGGGAKSVEFGLDFRSKSLLRQPWFRHGATHAKLKTSTLSANDWSSLWLHISLTPPPFYRGVRKCEIWPNFAIWGVWNEAKYLKSGRVLGVPLSILQSKFDVARRPQLWELVHRRKWHLLRENGPRECISKSRQRPRFKSILENRF